MLTYFLQVNLCWLLFYALYYVLLSRETFFRLNRIYLIISLLAGLILPICADFLKTETPLAAIVPPDSIMLPEFVVGMQNQMTEWVIVPNTEGGITWWLLLVRAYQIGVMVLGIRFLYGLGHLYKIFKTSQVEKENDFYISNIVTPSRDEAESIKGVTYQPFSFFKVIFINKNQFQEADYQSIMQHEKAHAEQWHSLDVVFLELLKIVFWFSPLVYLYRFSLKNIHEYLADAAVLRSASKKQYGTLLIQQAQSGNVLALVNPFFSQLKKRIIMMTRNPSKRRTLVKYTLVVPIFLLLVSFLASPNNAVMTQTAAISESVISNIEAIETPFSTFENKTNGVKNESLTPAVVQEKAKIDPYISFANMTGGLISDVAFKQFDNVKITDKNTGKELEYEKLNYSILRVPRKDDPVQINYMSSTKDLVKALIQKAQTGDSYVFMKIRFKLKGEETYIEYRGMSFIISPKTDDRTDQLTINNARIIGDTAKPNPIFTFTNGHVQGFISVNEMSSQTEIVGMEMSRKPIKKCEILSFTLTKTGADGRTEKVENQTGQFNAEVTRLIKSSKVGDVFVFSNVKMKNTEGVIFEPAATQFNVNSLSNDTKYNINISSSNVSEKPIAKVPNKDGVYTIVDELPEFPNGQKAMFTWLGQNIKYPAKARENGVEGTVYIGFVVGIDGALSNITIKRGISEDCNQEAMRVISAMPKWKPGKNQGKEVPVAYTLPIKFKLDGNNVNKTTKVIEEVRIEPKSDDNNAVFTMVDDAPEFEGGQASMFKWMATNIRYPIEARNKGIEGAIYVSFIVEKDGSITVSDVKRDKNTLIGQPINEVVVTALSNANKLTPNKDSIKVIETNGMIGYKIVDSPLISLLENEGKRVFSTMPKWKAGKHNGQPVRVAYVVPIKFKLE